MSFNLLALVSAGKVTEDDDVLGIMQNISREHAHTIGKWLALSTGGPVELRLMGIGDFEEIRYTPEQVRAGMRRADQVIYEKKAPGNE